MKDKLLKILKGIGSVFLFPFKEIKKLKKPVKIVLSLILIAAIAVGGFAGYKNKKAKEASKQSETGTSVVRKGKLTNSITGSGTVEPIEQREIVPEVNGKIVQSYFSEGDSVKTGDTLYRFEMTAATNAIESAENNVEKAQTNLSNRQSNLEKVNENIDKLTVKASASGKISDLTLRVGEEASGKICTLTNFKEQTATVPFNSSHIDSIKVGDKANVAVDKYMINVEGKVVRKYTAPDTLASGAVVYYVEIRLSNDYVLEENVNVTASIGSISSASYGTVKYATPVTVNAEQRGKVQKVNFKNGDWVNQGEVIAVLENNDLVDELRNARQSLNEAQMNLTEAMNNLEDKQEDANKYIVTSPIDGVILTKTYNTGDTINGQNAPAMMVVADMSKMKFTISADELDIAKIQIGQSVQVTADALEGQRLIGTITNVSKLGTASNGVTNYPIEVTIDEPGELMPGMNVSAEIIVEEVYNALYLPIEAVEYFGGKYYVTVVGEMENMPEIPDMPQGGFGGQRSSFGSNKNGNNTENKEGGSKSENPASGEDKAQRPEGGFSGQRPEGGFSGQRPEGGFSGQRPEGGFSGQRPEGGFSGQRPEGGFSGQRPEGGFSGQRPEGTEGEMPQRPEGGFGGQKPEGTEGEKPQSGENSGKTEETVKPADDKKTEEKEDKSKNEKKEDSNKKGEESATDNKNGKNSKNGQQTKREEPKIKLSGKEERIEVEIGITTDSYYEIKSGVKYGQVVKNSTQTSSSTGMGMMRGGMPGGMMGGMGGMSGGNRMGGMSGGNRNMGSSRMGGR